MYVNQKKNIYKYRITQTEVIFYQVFPLNR